MPLTAAQRERIRAELAREAGALRRAAPPERDKLIREALERAGVILTWEEWAALAPELLPGEAGREG